MPNPIRLVLVMAFVLFYLGRNSGALNTRMTLMLGAVFVIVVGAVALFLRG